MAKVYPKEQLESSRDLRGQIAPGKTLANMTPLETAVLRHQGLVDEEDNIKPEAFMQIETGPNLPAHIPAPVPLEDLDPNAAMQVEDAISEIQGEAAEPVDSIDVDKDAQIEEPLEPPDVGMDDLPPGDESVDNTGFSGGSTMNVETLISGSKEPIPCPRCTYDIRQRFENPEFTDADKAMFTRSVMSKKLRFEKDFPVFGGAGTITLRSRSQSEMEMILDYVRGKLRDEEILPGGDYMTQMQRFHIVASVAAISVSGDAEEGEEFPTLDAIAADDSTQGSPIEILDQLIFGSGRSSGLYSAVTSAWLEFERLYGWFASRAHEPDF